MQNVIKSYLDQIKIGRKQSFRKLTMFPLLSAYSSYLDYLLLDEALREELVEVVIENYPSVGRGTDPRLESKKITGFALSLDDQILHLCIFARRNGQGRKNHPSRMERHSQRRRKRVY